MEIPKTAKLTKVIGYTIEYTVVSVKAVYSTNDSSSFKKFASAQSLSDEQIGSLCLEVVVKAIRAYQAAQPEFELMITPSGKIYPDPAFSLN